MDNIIKAIAWVALGLGGLMGLYIGARVIFRAWFRSKSEYQEEIKKRRKEHE